MTRSLRAASLKAVYSAATLALLSCSSDKAHTPGSSVHDGGSGGSSGATANGGAGNESNGGSIGSGGEVGASNGGAAGTAAGGTPMLPPLPAYDGGQRGCDPGRVAVAHAPGGEALSPQPAGAPHTCYYPVGDGAMDPQIVVHPSGTLFFAPVNGTLGVASSKDDGMTWSAALTPDPGPGSWVHPWLYVDPSSGRLFFNVYNLPDGSCPDKGGGAQLWFSDDLGKTWENHVVGCDSKDYGKLIAGPAVTDATKAALMKSGYPSVLYYCAEGPTPIAGPDRFCYRSVDGGKTFTRTKSDAFVKTRDSTNGFPLAGATAPDGTIYTCMTSMKGLAVSVSRDEGDSWTVVTVPGSNAGQDADHFGDIFLSNNIATDTSNAAYAAWIDQTDHLPHLSVSKDHGTTWSASLVLGAPGVKFAKYVDVRVSKPGYVAIEYWGSGDATGLPGTDGYLLSDGRRFDGYLAVVPDVFAAKPVVWSARISAASGPLIANGISVVVGEYLGAPNFTKDGSIWASFSQHLGNPSTFAVRMDAPPE
jgi:hypothetical protein